MVISRLGKARQQVSTKEYVDMDLGLGPGLPLNQALGQTVSLQLIQNMRILQCSACELEDLIQQELEDNPFLERHSEGTDFSRRTGDADDFRPVAIAKDVSLYQHLCVQLDLVTENECRLHQLSVDMQTFEHIGEAIIREIDNRGFFEGDIELIGEALAVAPEEVHKILHIIRQFEPCGVGAVDYLDCFLIQAKRTFPFDEQLHSLLSEHLHSLLSEHLRKCGDVLLDEDIEAYISKRMKIKLERAHELIGMIKTLTFNPGEAHEPDQPGYGPPDVILEEEGGTWQVRSYDDPSRTITINNEKYTRLSSEAKTDETRNFIKGCWNSAKNLVLGIKRRQETLLKVAQAIVLEQEGFLLSGAKRDLNEITRKEVATGLGYHPSTVGRAVRGTYMETPLRPRPYELNYFFPSDRKARFDAEDLITKIIEKEDESSPLSDSKILTILSNRGIDISRRTVAKYRNARDIPPSARRKKHLGDEY